jgi:hypothetical protein
LPKQISAIASAQTTFTHSGKTSGNFNATYDVGSYMAQSAIMTLTFDLKAFMSDAVTNGSSDMQKAGTSQAFANTWYLTDVFAGFEAWTGNDTVGIKETFSIDIK